MARRIAKIKPLVPDDWSTPPEGSVAAGTTPDGRQLWKRTRTMARNVPMLEPGEEERIREALQATLSKEKYAALATLKEVVEAARDKGLNPKQMYRKHPTTGEPLYPRNKYEIYEETKLFVMEHQGNGNSGPVEYVPPSAAVVAAQEKARAVEAMQRRLAEALVDDGVDPVELVRAIRNRGTTKLAAPVAAPEPEELDVQAEVGEEVFPVHTGGGYYRFSNGERLQMTKEAALEKQTNLDVERSVAAVVGEELEVAPEI